MGAGVLGSNTTIKISSAIANAVVNAGTLFTASANSYAIVQITIIAGATADTLTVGSEAIQISSANVTLFGIYVGPSQVVSYTANITGTAKISGVQFTNSP